MRAPSLLIASATVALAACGVEAAHPDLGTPRLVAVIQEADRLDAIEVVSPTALAIELALHEAVARGDLPDGSGIVVVDVADAEDGGAADAAEAARDPAVVAAVVTPLADAAPAERAFLDAGVPVFSFSGLGGAGGDPLWRRVVPTAGDEAAAIASLAGAAPCVAGTRDAAPPVEGRNLGIDAAAAAGATDGCSAVVWVSDADGAIALEQALAALGSEVPVVLTSAGRVDRLAREAYPEARGTLAVVPCASLDVSSAPEAQRFVHAYQAAHGSAPGLCGAEAYGVGRWLEAFPDAAAVARSLRSAERIPTPAGALSLAPDAARGAVVEQVVGVRWLPAGLG
jgi:hypothetical protein